MRIAAQLYDKPVQGVIYTRFKKDVPNLPRQLSSGKISTSVTQGTTAILYRDALISQYGRMDIVPSENILFLNRLVLLEGEESDLFIRRDKVYRNTYQLAAQGEKILMEIQEMLRPDLPIYPNPTRDCAWQCGFQDANPRVLEEVVFPYFKEIVDFFHGHGLPVILHCCGYQETALPLIVQAGFDGLNPMEVKTGNDIFKFAEQYGDRLLFVGGLDEGILESRDRAVIRRGVTAFLDGMKARGARFLYGSDHSLSTNIDYADYLYSLAVYREHRAL